MMRATDSDNGRNGTIFYSIVSGNDQGNFYIGSKCVTVVDEETHFIILTRCLVLGFDWPLGFMYSFVTDCIYSRSSCEEQTLVDSLKIKNFGSQISLSLISSAFVSVV